MTLIAFLCYNNLMPQVKNERPAILSITGTKGKSTIAYILSEVLGHTENTLRVDTTGYYVNGDLKGGFADSTRLAGLVPTVSPGRFLVMMQDIPVFTAILECSLGCSNAPGLGYSHHSVGIFTNVFEDHMGSTKRLNSREDIAAAKDFIFKRIRPDGYAVFNADDKLVCSRLGSLKESVSKIPCGHNFNSFDINQHLKGKGVYVTVDDGWVVVKSESKISRIVKVKDVTWTFDDKYKPSVDNLLLIVGSLWAHNKGKIPSTQRKLLAESRLNPYGGRLTSFRAQTGTLIIADYAHEKYSLEAVSKLARSMTRGKGRVIGVVRLAYDRTDELIADTAKHIAPHFDEFVVYDKIDGFWRKPKKTLGSFKMKKGYTSKLFSANLAKNKARVTRIIREDEALEYAASISRPEDVVVVIVNDDIVRSIGFIREKFNAEQV